jgi:hypothetical protein
MADKRQPLFFPILVSIAFFAIPFIVYHNNFIEPTIAK